MRFERRAYQPPTSLPPRQPLRKPLQSPPFALENASKINGMCGCDGSPAVRTDTLKLQTMSRRLAPVRTPSPTAGARPPPIAKARALLDEFDAWRWVLAIVTLTVTLTTFALALNTGQAHLRHASQQRLIIAEAVLRAAVERDQYLPAVLALDTEVRALLGDLEAPHRVAAVNAKFEAIARTSHVAAIDLLVTGHGDVPMAAVAFAASLWMPDTRRYGYLDGNGRMSG